MEYCPVERVVAVAFRVWDDATGSDGAVAEGELWWNVLDRSRDCACRYDCGFM